MALYTVLEAPDGNPESVAFVREGFSWSALIFTVLWALWQRMWVVALLLFTVSTTLAAASSYGILDPSLGTLIQLGIALLFGFEARQLKMMSLERAGYRRAGMIQASRYEAAELTYFADRAAVAPQPVPARYRAAPDDTLGIFGNV